MVTLRSKKALKQIDKENNVIDQQLSEQAAAKYENPNKEESKHEESKKSGKKNQIVAIPFPTTLKGKKADNKYRKVFEILKQVLKVSLLESRKCRFVHL